MRFDTNIDIKDLMIEFNRLVIVANKEKDLIDRDSLRGVILNATASNNSFVSYRTGCIKLLEYLCKEKYTPSNLVNRLRLKHFSLFNIEYTRCWYHKVKEITTDLELILKLPDFISREEFERDLRLYCNISMQDVVCSKNNLDKLPYKIELLEVSTWV